jgi:hypothetical protein
VWAARRAGKSKSACGPSGHASRAKGEPDGGARGAVTIEAKASPPSARVSMYGLNRAGLGSHGGDRTDRVAGSPPSLAAAAASLAFVPLCLLISPVTWKAHHVLLLPLFFVLACAALGAARQRLAFAGLGAYWVLCGLMNEEVLGRTGKLLFERLSIVTWADLALLAVTLTIAARDRSSGPVQRSEPMGSGVAAR